MVEGSGGKGGTVVLGGGRGGGGGESVVRTNGEGNVVVGNRGGRAVEKNCIFSKIDFSFSE